MWTMTLSPCSRMNLVFPTHSQAPLHSLLSEEIAATGGGGEFYCGGSPPAQVFPHRQYVLCNLPRITTFDFSGVTKADRTTAEVWKRMNIRPKKVRIKQDVL